MKKFMNSFVKKMTLRNCLIATGFFLFVLWLIEFSPVGISKLLQITGGVNILDFESRYDSSFAYAHLLRMGQKGRSFHLTRIMPLDSLFSIGFMFFSLTWLSFLLRPITLENCILRCLPLISILYLISDWTENICITIMLLNFPNPVPRLCMYTGSISAFKQYSIYSMAAIFLISISCVIIKQIILAIIKRVGHD